MIDTILEFIGMSGADVPDSLAFAILSCFILVGVTEFFRLFDLLIDKASMSKK